MKRKNVLAGLECSAEHLDYKLINQSSFRLKTKHVLKYAFLKCSTKCKIRKVLGSWILWDFFSQIFNIILFLHGTYT